MDAQQASDFCCDLSTASKAVQQGVSLGPATGAVLAWAIWREFTGELGLDPFLQTYVDKVQILQVFSVRVQCGELSASGNSIRARSVEDYVRYIAQAFLNVGAKDQRLNSANLMDFQLQRMLSCWKKTNPAPDRVKPIQIQVIR